MASRIEGDQRATGGPPNLRGEMDYRPDRAFMAELKRTDPRLGCRFNGKFFVITYERAHGGAVPIMSIRDDNGDFRHPDPRDIQKIKESDLQREDFREKFLRLSNASEHLKRQAEDRQRRRDEIRAMTKDSKRQLRRAYERIYETMGVEKPLTR